MIWVSRIMTINVETILPAVVGRFLDQKYGWNFCTPVGLGLGLFLGVSHLVAISRRRPTTKSAGEADEKTPKTP